MDKPVIRQVDHYQLLDIIGQGGMGIVYRAIDPGIGRTVAIKMLHGAFAEDKDLLARFHREVRSTANLQHKNIVTVHALGDFEGFPYMVMEYLEGQSIAELIASRRPLHLVEKLGLVCQVCEGLQYAHEHGVIHRDIKPANVLVLKDGTAKIVDFGIARAGRGETLTRTGQIIGSIYYMSPEQIGGGAVDARTDVYSAGVMLYEFLTGELPFKAADNDPQATFIKILNDPVPSLGKYLATYPIALDEILAKSLEKNANARYQTAEDLGYDLSHLRETLQRGMTQNFLSQAKVAVDRKDWEVARQQLQEVLKFERRNKEANDLLQFVRQQIQQQQRSVQIAQLRSQAQIALAGLQFEEASECKEQALRLDPKNEELIAFSQSIKDQIERARELADALRRGQAALYAGDLNDAELAVQKALDIDHEHTEARVLENLVKKELQERTRRSQLQGFVEEARREISDHNYYSALRSLQKAHAIDPTDSNIRELLGWAARGHEQEKLRNQLQTSTNAIGQLLGADRYTEALEACDEALRSFPEEPSLLKLQQLAKHHRDLAARRQAVDEAGAEARRLAENDRSDEAIEVLERALNSFPNESNLQALLAIFQGESESRLREKEEREAYHKKLAAEETSNDPTVYEQQEVFEALMELQNGLVQNLPISQLHPLADRVVSVVDEHRLSAAESAQCSAALVEFKVRSARWKWDFEELEQLDGSIRELKGSSEIDSFLDRARVISQRHEKDEVVQERYHAIQQFAEDLRLKCEAVAGQVSSIVESMQGIHDLETLLAMESQAKQVSESWLNDSFIRSLLDRAFVRIEDVRQHRQQVLQELAQLSESLATASSSGQVRLLLEQAMMLAEDSQDTDVANAIGNLRDFAQGKLQRLELVVSKLQELAARIAEARSVSDIEECDSTSQLLLSDATESEEAKELFKKVQHAIGEKRKECKRIWTSLDLLVQGSAKATGRAELDLILARRRDLLKKYPEDLHFKELESRLEASVSERRAYLADLASAEKPVDIDEVTNSESTTERAEGLDIETAVSAERAVLISPNVQAIQGRKLRPFAVAAATLVVLVAIIAFFSVRKTITVLAVPSAATVTVDGEPCARPCTLRLAAGRHELRATEPGFEDLSQTLSVPRFGTGLPAITISLTPKQQLTSSVLLESNRSTVRNARILVQTSIPGVSIFVDGSASAIGKTGNDGRLQFQTSGGSHQVRIQLPGFAEGPAQMIAVSDGGQAFVSFDLKRTKDAPSESQAIRSNFQGQVAKTESSSPSLPLSTSSTTDTLMVVQAPAGAEIHIDQQLAGNSTGGPLKNRIQPGQRTVEVFLPGYQTWRQTLSVEPGQEIDLVANLIPAPAAIANENSPAPRPSTDASDANRQQIQQLLDRYASAVTHRDIKQLHAVWPDVPKEQLEIVKGLSRDHKGFSLSILVMKVSLLEGGEDAVVKCKQVSQFDGKTSEDNITFYMGKLNTGWIITQIPRSN